MNRKQAENILDAYVLLSTTNAKAASDSLREVILDAMTTTYYPISISQPHMPTVEPYKPTTTWKSEVETGQMEVTRWPTTERPSCCASCSESTSSR